MKIEEIEREAELFDRKDNAFIHLEKTENTPYKVIATGDVNILFQGIYGILCLISDQYKIEFLDLVKRLKRAYKTIGKREFND